MKCIAQFIVLVLFPFMGLYSQSLIKEYKVSVNNRLIIASDTLLSVKDLASVGVAMDSILLFLLTNDKDSIAVALKKPSFSAKQLQFYLNEKPVNAEFFKLEKSKLKELKLRKAPSKDYVIEVSLKYKKKFSIYDLLIVTCVRYMFANEQYIRLIEK